MSNLRSVRVSWIGSNGRVGSQSSGYQELSWLVRVALMMERGEPNLSKPQERRSLQPVPKTPLLTVVRV